MLFLKGSAERKKSALDSAWVIILNRICFSNGFGVTNVQGEKRKTFMINREVNVLMENLLRG